MTTTATTITEIPSRVEVTTKWIDLHGWTYVQAAVLVLNKRAKRLGLLPVEATITGTRTKTTTRSTAWGMVAHTKREVEVTITGQEVKLNGWALVGRIDHLTADSAVTAAGPGYEDFDLRTYADRGCVCDHCGVNRQRNTTLVLANFEVGKVMQVGSTCVKDFTGLDRNPAALLDFFCCMGSVFGDMSNEDLNGGFASGGGSTTQWDHILDFLPWVAMTIRCCGWTAASKADDQNPATKFTASSVRDIFTNPTRGKERQRLEEEGQFSLPTKADNWQALRSIVWARNLDGASDYETNLKAVIDAGVLLPKHHGLAASAVAMYQRSVNRTAVVKKATSEVNSLHVGAIKVRQEWQIKMLYAPRAFDTDYGTSYLYTFLDVNTGALMKWWGSKQVDEMYTVGAVLNVKATVKGHGEYNGRKETTVTRLALIK